MELQVAAITMVDRNIMILSSLAASLYLYALRSCLALFRAYLVIPIESTMRTKSAPTTRIINTILPSWRFLPMETPTRALPGFSHNSCENSVTITRSTSFDFKQCLAHYCKPHQQSGTHRLDSQR